MLKINSSEIYSFAALVDYQAGSIVSREIIQKNSGTITVFAFGEGQGLSEHKAPFDAMVYIVDGGAQVTINKDIFELKKGEMIILPADQIHALKALEKFKMALIMIR